MSDSSPSSLRPPLTDSRLAALFAYWDGKRRGRGMPKRSDIDPIEMRQWLGNLLLIDVTVEGRFIYRLYGTRFVDNFGRDMTGRSVDDLPVEQQERVRTDYEAVCASRQPRARLYTASFEVPQRGTMQRSEPQVVTWERLVMPLGDSEARVDMLLVAAYPLPDLRPSST
jgi:hypothetical protein